MLNLLNKIWTSVSAKIRIKHLLLGASDVSACVQDVKFRIGMLNGSWKTGNRFLIRWPVWKVRNR